MTKGCANEPTRSACPLNATLECLGDQWSLLIVRDLLFRSKHTYKDFLHGGEGVSTNILADRLRRLTDYGIIEKHPTRQMPDATCIASPRGAWSSPPSWWR